jgi:hypothetical protein
VQEVDKWANSRAVLSSRCGWSLQSHATGRRALGLRAHGGGGLLSASCYPPPLRLGLLIPQMTVGKPSEGLGAWQSRPADHGLMTHTFPNSAIIWPGCT